MELNKAINERRTIRKFTDYYVSDEELKEMMEAVKMTPSWANTQSWRFCIIRDKAKIAELVETYSVSNPARECSKGASVLIAACYEKDAAGVSRARGVNYNNIGNWGMFDLGAACQTLSLKIHDMNLGSVIIGAYDYEKAGKILEIPENIELAAIIAVGKPAEEKKAPKRKEFEEIVFKKF